MTDKLWCLIEEANFRLDFPMFRNRMQHRSSDITPPMPIALVIWETPINV